MARGMVRKRGDVYYVVYPLDGRKKWEKVGPKKREAERVLASRLEEIRLGRFKELKKIRFGEFVDLWVHDYVSVSVKGSTAAAYESIINAHLRPGFGAMELTRLSTSRIQAFVSDLVRAGKLSNKTIVNIVVVLKEMLRHAVRWGYLHQNPADAVERPRVTHREMRFLTPGEVQSFLAKASPTYHPLFLTAVMTGLRRGELLGLLWKDIDWDAGLIHVRRSLYRGQLVEPKTETSRRRVALPQTVATALKKLWLKSPRHQNGFVFCSELGKPLDPDNVVKREFLPAIKAAKLERLRFHDLRHTFASLLISQGESVKFVQDQLGHSSVQTTLDRYGHLFPEDRSDAAARLDERLFGATRKGA